MRVEAGGLQSSDLHRQLNNCTKEISVCLSVCQIGNSTGSTKKGNKEMSKVKGFLFNSPRHTPVQSCITATRSGTAVPPYTNHVKTVRYVRLI